MDERGAGESRVEWRALRMRLVAGILVLLGVFAVSWVFNTRQAGLPHHFHPDEPSKAKQVLGREHNFHHPLLLLNLTKVAWTVSGEPEVGRPEGVDDAGYEALVELRRHQAVVLLGRRISATAAALAVVLLALSAWLERGVLAAACVGLLCAVTPMLVLNAHFMKEEGVFMLTIGAWVLGTVLYVRQRRGRWWRWALAGLGVAMGFALAGKWVGGVFAVAGLVTAVALPAGRRAVKRTEATGDGGPGAATADGLPGDGPGINPGAAEARITTRTEESPPPASGEWRPRLQQAAVVVAIAAAVVVLVNFPALWQLGSLVGGLRFEATHVLVEGHRGMEARGAPGWLAGLLWREAGWLVTALATWEVVAAAVIAMGLGGRRGGAVVGTRGLLTLVLLAASVGYLLVVSQSAVVVERYLLPTVAMTFALAGLGLERLARLGLAALRREQSAPAASVARSAAPGMPRLDGARAEGLVTAVALLALVAVCLPHVHRNWRIIGAFRDDSRFAAAAWVRDNLPADARVLESSLVALHFQPLPFAVEPAWEPADVASLDELRARGYTHVAITDLNYRRYFEPPWRPVASREQEHARRVAWYESLPAEHELLWERRTPWLGAPVNPSVHIYELRPRAVSPATDSE